MSEPMLSVENLHVYYGGSHVIKGASLTLGSGSSQLWAETEWARPQ